MINVLTSNDIYHVGTIVLLQDKKSACTFVSDSKRSYPEIRINAPGKEYSK
jgi:hypothetical protein